MLSERLCRRLPASRILIFQLTTIVSFFLHLGGSFYIFYGLLNPPKELLLALLGSATFAVGLALKDLVASLISGITIIMDPPFQVGDRVQFKDIYGEIKHIGLRAVRLQTLDNYLVTIPNLNFVNEYVICGNKGKLNLNVNMKFYFALENDFQAIRTILNEVVATSRYSYLNEPVVIVLDNVWKADVLCFELILRAHVLDARYEKDFQTDVFIRATEALLKIGVKYPDITTSNQNVQAEKFSENLKLVTNQTLLEEKISA